ncbi:hypothetical protein [Cloacibacillus porcorum]|nr:hypothetical protein [Cloacibacillus porcorum]
MAAGYRIGESGAHRYIEKRAMESRRSRRETVGEVIANETLFSK